MNDNPFMIDENNPSNSNSINSNPFMTDANNSGQNGGTGKQSTAMDMVDSFNDRVNSLASGALQATGKILDTVGVHVIDQQQLANQRALYAKAGAEARINSPKATIASDIIGDVANVAYTSALTGGAGFASPGATLQARALQQAGLAGAEGAAEYGDIDQRTQRGLLQGAAGAAGQVVGEKALEYAGKGINAVRSYIGDKVFKQDPQIAADIINKGGLLSAGSATGNEGLQQAEGYLGQLPVIGARGNVKNIASNIEQQAQDVLGSQGIEVGTSGITGASRGELAQTIKDEALKSYLEGKGAVSQAYKRAADIGTRDNLVIPLTGAAKAAMTNDAQELANMGFSALDKSGTKAGALIKNIQDIGQIPANQFESLRSQITGIMKDVKNSNTDSYMGKILGDVRAAMDDDLTQAAQQQGGEFKAAITQARNLWSEKVKPYNSDPFLKRVVKEGVDPDSLLNAAVAADHPALAAGLMKRLTPEGQGAYTKALLLNAAEKSVDDTTEKFSVRKFGESLGRMGETLDVLPEDLKQTVKGLKKTIAMSENILKASESKASTGNLIAGGGAVGLGVLAGLPAVLKAAPMIKVVSSMLTNPKMVRQLVRLGGGKLNPKTEGNTIMQLLRDAANSVSQGVQDSGVGNLVAPVGAQELGQDLVPQ